MQEHTGINGRLFFAFPCLLSITGMFQMAEGCDMDPRSTKHLVQSLVNLERHGAVKDVWARADSEVRSVSPVVMLIRALLRQYCIGYFLKLFESFLTTVT